jgi:hypothetical protein
VPFKLYSNPVCVVITIVPIGTPQVGCVTLEAVGTSTTVKTLIVGNDEKVTQVASANFLTYNV